MAIELNQYSQLKDYLTQVIKVSQRSDLPEITQVAIASHLQVDHSGVSRFLSGATKKPQKMMKNFIATYPLEFKRWPAGADKICRTLKERDVWYFLRLEKKILKKEEAAGSILKKVRVASFEEDDKEAVFTGSYAGPSEPRILKKEKIKPNCSRGKSLRVMAAVSLLREGKGKEREGTWSVRCVPIAKAPIAIPYRGHQTKLDAKGMVFDHMRVQLMTNFPTRAVMPENLDIVKQSWRLFRAELKQHPAALRYGKVTDRGIVYPPGVRSSCQEGLLLIPGRARKVEKEPIRLEHEYRLIRKALNRGQPMFGICGGALRIWEQSLIWTIWPDDLREDSRELADWHERSTLIEVTDHVYNGGMVRLGTTGTKAVCNVQIHDVRFERDSWTKKILFESVPRRQKRLTVNSVHSSALNPERVPLNLRVSGWAVQNPSISFHTRRQTEMDPQEDTVEAFESVAGAPIVGLQWHPEAYNHDEEGGKPHEDLLKYMAKAGNAYLAKRKVLIEFKAKINDQAKKIVKAKC